MVIVHQGQRSRQITSSNSPTNDGGAFERVLPSWFFDYGKSPFHPRFISHRSYSSSPSFRWRCVPHRKRIECLWNDDQRSEQLLSRRNCWNEMGLIWGIIIITRTARWEWVVFIGEREGVFDCGDRLQCELCVEIEIEFLNWASSFEILFWTLHRVVTELSEALQLPNSSAVPFRMMMDWSCFLPHKVVNLTSGGRSIVTEELFRCDQRNYFDNCVNRLQGTIEMPAGWLVGCRPRTDDAVLDGLRKRNETWPDPVE